MKEEIISFETAKSAKEKGFNEVCNSCYDINGKVYHGMNHKNDLGENVFSAPTQSLLQKWIREVHNIYVNIEYWNAISNNHKYKINYFREINNTIFGNFYKSYEEALEKGLQEALKLIK